MTDFKHTMEQPSFSAAPASGMRARVFTMPQQYRYGVKGNLHEPMVKQPSVAPVQVNTPTVPAPKAPPKPPSLKKKALMTKKLFVVGVVVLFVLAVGGYFLVRSTQESTSGTVSTTSGVSRPAPKPEPAEEQEIVPKEEQESEPRVFPAEVTSGIDSDSDGLTDTEENLVYETNPKLPDTDADGFLDGNEVFHGYNPGGTAPGTLLESGLVRAQERILNGQGYIFYYPTIWLVSGIDAGVLFDTGTGEGFRVTTMAKASDRTLHEWAAQVQSPLEDPREGVTKNGLRYLHSGDNLVTYVDLNPSVGVVFIFEYDTGVNARVDYLQTLQMMLNSVEVVPQIDEEGE